VEDFEAANPEFKVEVTDLTWSDGHQKIVAAFAGGAVPDLLELGSDWIAEFADANALMDMTSEYANLGDAYLGWAPTIYQDRCWALPWYLSTRVLYQNDELVRYAGANPSNPPVFWADLLLRAKRISQVRGELYGYGVNAAERHRLYKKFLPYLWSAGGDVLTPGAPSRGPGAPWFGAPPLAVGISPCRVTNRRDSPTSAVWLPFHQY
jgi:multiple sugar transport system substrate-binding protein